MSGLETETNPSGKFSPQSLSQNYQEYREAIEEWNLLYGKAKIGDALRCLWCANWFKYSHPNRKYCSIRCMLNADQKRDKPDVKTFSCAVCGKQFEGNGHNTKYCSSECSQKGYVVTTNRRLEKKKLENMQTKTCLWCRKPFNPKIRRQRFCCILCRYRYVAFENRIRTVCYGDSEKTNNCLKILENQGIYSCFPLKKLDDTIETERRDLWIYKRLQA